MASNTTSPLTLHNGTTSQALKAGQPNIFKVQAGEHYRIEQIKDGQEQLLDDVIAKKIDKDLLLEYGDGTKVILENYYEECTTTGACDITLPGQQAGGYTITGESATGPALGDGSNLVYMSGNHDVLMGMAQGNETLLSTLSGIKGTEVSYTPSSLIGGMSPMAALGVGLGVAAVAGAAGGGGGGARPARRHAAAARHQRRARWPDDGCGPRLPVRPGWRRRTPPAR